MRGGIVRPLWQNPGVIGSASDARRNEVAAFQVDIGILTIRDDENRAVLNAFPDRIGSGVHKGKNRDYALRFADAGRGARYRVAIVRQPEQGTGEAQDAARDMLEDVDPSMIIVVG